MRSRRLSSLAVLVTVCLSLATVGAGCDPDELFPNDEREVHAIASWTHNPTRCDVEGDDVRAQRSATHLVVNPDGAVDDAEAVVATCSYAEGSDDCSVAADFTDASREVSLRMQRAADGVSWTSETHIVTDEASCIGYLESATLTFPVAQQFRLELRRSHYSVPGAADCFSEGPAQAEAAGCTDLEVLTGSFAATVEGDYESSSSGGGGGFDD